MKKVVTIGLAFLLTNMVIGQRITLNSTIDWFEKNKISIRKAFDGSVNENRPASITFLENHRSNNDFFSVDLAVKVSEIKLIKKSDALVAYPKIEWHKSTDSTERKDKLIGGLNFEFAPIPLKLQEIDDDLQNHNGWVLAPWFLGTTSFKRNFIDDVFESQTSLQMSFVSNYDFLPGATFRDKKDNFRGRYYPYLGFEHFRLPDFFEEGQTEEFNSLFLRLFVETWPVSRQVQLNLEYLYRKNLRSSSMIRQNLPLFSVVVNYYPGEQETFCIGYEYKDGYEPDSKFNLVRTSSLRLSLKI